LAHTSVKWIAAEAAKREDFTLDVLDLSDPNLPFFNEAIQKERCS
jgi:hypothetical protein